MTVAPGKANAHFTVNRPNCTAVNRAASANWNRVLLRSAPHPFQAGAAARVTGGLLRHLFGIAATSALPAVPSLRSPRYSAIPRLRSSERPAAIAFMDPVVKDS